MNKWVVAGLVLSVTLTGCKTGHIRDPNNPADVGSISPQVLRQNLQSINESLVNRLSRHEFDRRTYRQLVAQAARELSSQVKPESVKPEQAWQFGEVLKDAHLWAQAEPVLRVAVKYATDTKNDDRRVNDTLRLAVVLAHEDKVPEALTTARLAFNAPPNQLAPVLLATYLELAPAAQGKGHDLELAKLVEDAIACHNRTQVDPKSDAGKIFVLSRPYHMGKAWMLVAALYSMAGKADLAAQAEQKAEAAREGFPSVIKT